jgi:hypothetical protein
MILRTLVCIGAISGCLIATRAQSARTDAAQFGSLNGQVTVVGAPEHVLSGARVLVRRVHAGAADFYFERATERDGTYSITYLLPGRYSIEIDPRGVSRRPLSAVSRVLLIDVAAERSSVANLSVASDPRGSKASDRSISKKTLEVTFRSVNNTARGRVLVAIRVFAEAHAHIYAAPQTQCIKADNARY